MLYYFENGSLASMGLALHCTVSLTIFVNLCHKGDHGGWGQLAYLRVE